MDHAMPDPPERDEKDWTWTLTRRCDECGLAAGEIGVQQLPERIFIAAEEWVQILRSSPAVDARPRPGVWSPLEYGAHVRDVLVTFGGRLTLMLTEDNPIFANWDQDQAAIDGAYGEQDPELVADALEELAQSLAAQVAALTPDQLTRTGQRSNGSSFTVLTLLQYFMHDVVHHLWDVTGQQDGVESLTLE